jgi:hypothetical protein
MTTVNRARRIAYPVRLTPRRLLVACVAPAARAWARLKLELAWWLR